MISLFSFLFLFVFVLVRLKYIEITECPTLCSRGALFLHHKALVDILHLRGPKDKTVSALAVPQIDITNIAYGDVKVDNEKKGLWSD